ncbi:hypothetical protein GDO78_014840 [Eleutherodactylus coqui]|uniref:Uncharacterized protein n=1 Tax=Eleutherodactylus coqui TaxID=57060 RepID=A0A8J6EE56_ELECQ|nr:hypothetical protein GDO78_014840 [Eleutherodactylus coqui]
MSNKASAAPEGLALSTPPASICEYYEVARCVALKEYYRAGVYMIYFYYNQIVTIKLYLQYYLQKLTKASFTPALGLIPTSGCVICGV